VFHHTPVLVLGIGIGIGQYYWVFGIGCLVWYRSNPNFWCLLWQTASKVQLTVQRLNERRASLSFSFLQVDLCVAIRHAMMTPRVQLSSRMLYAMVRSHSHCHMTAFVWFVCSDNFCFCQEMQSHWFVGYMLVVISQIVQVRLCWNLPLLMFSIMKVRHR